MKRYNFQNIILFPALILLLCMSAGCAQGRAVAARAEVPVTERAAAAAPTPIPFDPADVRMPQASGENVKKDNGAEMDASHTDQGYVMIRCSGKGVHKAGISTEEATYYYTLPEDGSYAVCPLQMGDGAYTVQVYEQLSGTKYTPLCKWKLNVALQTKNIPYLYPNQFVSYTPSDKAIRLSFEKAAGAKDDKAAAKQLYAYVASAIDYDYDKAANVQSGYLPSPDKTLSEGKGICFDYAALLAAMLRVQNIPTRLQMGELTPENVYHAWNLVCIGDEWYLMDATLDGQGHKDTDYTATKNY